MVVIPKGFPKADEMVQTIDTVLAAYNKTPGMNRQQINSSKVAACIAFVAAHLAASCAKERERALQFVSLLFSKTVEANLLAQQGGSRSN